MSDLIMVLLTNTLGESILVETLKSAAYFIIHSGYGLVPNGSNYEVMSKFRESRQCYFFIQSTKLDDLIEAYALDYNPDLIRSTFNFCIRHSI